MKNLRRTVIALLVNFTLLFNIERLDLNVENVIDIHTFTYFLIVVAATSLLLLPKLWKQPLYFPLSIWGMVYLLLRVFSFNERPLIGGIDTYLTITELTFLVVSLWLAYQLGQQILDFEEAVANITFKDQHRVRSLERALPDVQVEIARSRRYQSPLSLFVVTPERSSVRVNLHRTVEEVQRAMMTRYVLTGIGRVMGSTLRRTDMIIEQKEQERFIVLSPETPGTNAGIVIDRIQRAVGEQLGIAVKCGVASFPNNALTFEELVHEASSNLEALEHSPAPRVEMEPDAVLQAQT